MNNAAVVFDDKREENLKEKLAEERKEKAAYIPIPICGRSTNTTVVIEKAKQSRYIETFYNTVRIHSHCGYLSPNEYEEQYLKNLETDVTNLAS